ncbi:BZ3500_MvSof-1268-A1-R1_Chr6-3g08782 [Microbotryum saponariae]|uniref:BZ3500_MvSof-1268-A1-R1_Chr6-3g08782 protein n=1 Tax=Microbotryum saponariae TaxID=289078 RepID=A0A2X0KJJ1_9BASI|nr:BZ3500_MvSof-1268-A1-R1_Chr6-3g08782 [Microbotryum saponariae]SDA07383.1 BZ3501_MvSof-1269-A2-R1_Chr6-2g08485 [Microbotryum saponariae]
MASLQITPLGGNLCSIARESPAPQLIIAFPPHRASTPADSKGAFSALLHGSPEAKAEGEKAEGQHSKLVGRNRSVHEFQKHKVLPQHVEQYKELIAGYYKGIHESEDFHAKLTGSWEIVVGEVDTFVHIFEYEGLTGFEKTKAQIKASHASLLSPISLGHLEFFNHEILPLIQTRTSQLNQEFAFWQCAEPRTDLGGIVELRTYSLKPGALLEWENQWRVGLEARLRSGHSPLGAWFSQLGELHQVHHMWHYATLEERRATREKAWTIDTWSGTVTKTVKLTEKMDANVLRALPFSPMR